MSYNLEELTEQVKDIFKYNWDCSDDELTHVIDMMREWAKNKSKIYEAFGGQLIYAVPAEEIFKLSSDTKRSKVNELCDWIEENKFGHPNCFELTDFIDMMGEDLYDNVVQYDYGFYDYEQDTEKVISKGSKIIKAFKNFISDKDTLVEIQNKASMLSQEDKISGKICFSIHPLDYLSMSNNTYNWTTCQELREGERRMGNISYMLDNSTIVCYIMGEDNVKLPIFPEHIPWNSKKWRVTIHTNITNTIFMLGRPYPFDLPRMRNRIHETLAEIFQNIEYLSDWQIENTIFNDYGDAMEGYYNLFNSVFLKDRLIVTHSNSLNYNDLLYSTVYEPYLCYDQRRYEGFIPMFIGNRVKCFKCGDANITSSTSYLCEECFDKKYPTETYKRIFCADCGNSIDDVNDQHIISTSMRTRKTLCKECYGKYIIGKYYNS